MDYFDQRILSALKDGKHHKFSAQKDQVGFSHNTHQQHLTGLIEKGIVLKEKDLPGVLEGPDMSTASSLQPLNRLQPR
jgi:hypothetical protein